MNERIFDRRDGLMPVLGDVLVPLPHVLLGGVALAPLARGRSCATRLVQFFIDLVVLPVLAAPILQEHPHCRQLVILFLAQLQPEYPAQLPSLQ